MPVTCPLPPSWDRIAPTFLWQPLTCGNVSEWARDLRKHRRRVSQKLPCDLRHTVSGLLFEPGPGKHTSTRGGRRARYWLGRRVRCGVGRGRGS